MPYRDARRRGIVSLPMDTPAPRIEDLLEHRRWVTALARSLVADDALALDLVQDAYARALVRPPARGGGLRGWLATVVRNRLRDRARVESRRTRREAAVARPEGAGSAADLAATADAHRRLIEAVVALEEPYREAVLLRFYEGLSAKEVGKRQGVPASTARTRIARALARLRGRLGDGDGDWALALLPLLAAAPEPPPPIASTPGPGALLMAHKLKILAAVLLPLVLVAVLVTVTDRDDPEPPREAEDMAAADAGPVADTAPMAGADPVDAGSATDAPTADAALPETRRADAVPLPVPDGFVVEIAGDGGVLVAGRRVEGDLVVRLMVEAEKKRDESHPMMPSERAPVIRAAATTPWSRVREVLLAGMHPDVRIYRFHFVARRGEAEVAVPVIFPKDRGLARARVRLPPPLEARVLLGREAGTTSVRLFGVDYGSVGSAFEALRATEAKLPMVLDVEGEVPLKAVIRALDEETAAWVSVEDEPVPAVRTMPEAADLVRAALPERAEEPPDAILDGDEGLAPGFRDWLSRNLAAWEGIGLLESLVVPEPDDRARLAVLSGTNPSTSGLEDLAGMARTDRRLLLGLADAYLVRGTTDDCRRALNLAGWLAVAEPRRQFDRSWWYGETLVLRAYLGFAETERSRQAVDAALGLIGEYERLGVLDRSPYRVEIEALRERGEWIGRWLK